MAITSTRLATGGLNYEVYTSSGNNAITTIIICNTLAAVSQTDEVTNSANLTLYLGTSATDTTTIVKNLNIPPGETVFFSEERVVLSNGDKVIATSSLSSALSVTVSTLSV
jgi:hypothetical protein